MNISCDIIEDLLPLYRDGVCSAQSRLLVESHLSGCEHCRGELGKLEEDFAFSREKLDDTGPIQAIARGWRRSRVRSFLTGAVLAVLLLAGGLWGLTGWNVHAVPAQLLQVSDVCRLSDGRIAYRLFVDDDRNLFQIDVTVTEEGAYCMTPVRALITSRRTYETGAFDKYFALDVQEESDLYGRRITSLYAGPVGRGVLVWEEGMELPAASAEVEARLAPHS